MERMDQSNGCCMVICGDRELACSLSQSQIPCMIVGRPFPFLALFLPFNEGIDPQKDKDI